MRSFMSMGGWVFLECFKHTVEADGRIQLSSIKADIKNICKIVKIVPLL